ncbi:unnamed protein product [Brassicogethes aeneus]|uniref:Tetratricopeptide SHNi-TPR domain-containing protein n=1 Tax=Brassicogethes aeneus TaxID=1431903 RepID=A0A9P0BHR1_BRAAE|nr:unnamed protein product [Brassicogethes aeneus]
MADVTVNSTSHNPKELLSQGIKAYVLQDYDAAVQALSQASQLLAEEHGDDLHESLGEVYLYYGKALLALSRDESDALGDAVPKNDDDEEEEEEVEEGDEEDNQEKKDEEQPEVAAGPSEEKASEENNETTEEKDDEPTDLQVAWEVLELAKKIFEAKGDDGKKSLAETFIILGEISLESENFESAVSDIKQGLDMQKSLYGSDSRTVAETLYKLGIAYSTNTQIEEAVDCFNDSLSYLKNRINVLEKSEDKKDSTDDEVKEIKDLIPEILEKIADMKNYKEEDKCCDGMSRSILTRFECLRIHLTQE